MGHQGGAGNVIGPNVLDAARSVPAARPTAVASRPRPAPRGARDDRSGPGRHLVRPVVQAAVARMVALDVYPAGPAISPKASANVPSLQAYIGNIKPGQMHYAGAVDDRFAAPAGHRSSDAPPGAQARRGDFVG